MNTEWLEQEAGVARAAALLTAGRLVGLPTETVYGLAGRADDPKTVAAIFTAKERPSFDPLIVHLPDTARARALAVFPDWAERLAGAFWPGPLTLVLPRRPDSGIPDLVTAGLPGVGLRVPAHPLAQAVLSAAGVPVAAPSANRFGSISPTTAEHVRQELDGRIDAILDGGACEKGLESTVVGADEEGHPVVLRAGALTAEELESVCGHPLAVRAGTSRPPGVQSDGPLPAPGMVRRHYAPRTPLSLIDSAICWPEELSDIGVLGMQLPESVVQRSGASWELSAKGDPVEAATRLFAGLRELDAAGVRRIIARPLPEAGLGRAINDRLRRASATLA